MGAVFGTVMESKKGNRGATAVEFALVLPLFVLLMLGIIDFGRYFFVQHTVQFATREGTRLALVGGTLPNPDGTPMSRVASIIRKIEESAGLANLSGLEISVFPITGYSDPTGWENRQDAGGPGQFMRVRTRYTYQFLTPFIGDFFSNGVNIIQASSTYRNEGFPE
jgi:Flp pilus assembly pilin Flp